MTYYQFYLQSNSWYRLASEAKRLAGYRCRVCNAAGELHAHHRTYERLGGELLDDITVLCKTCHDLFSQRIGKVHNDFDSVMVTHLLSLPPEFMLPPSSV